VQMEAAPAEDMQDAADPMRDMDDPMKDLQQDNKKP